MLLIIILCSSHGSIFRILPTADMVCMNSDPRTKDIFLAISIFSPICWQSSSVWMEWTWSMHYIGIYTYRFILYYGFMLIASVYNNTCAHILKPFEDCEPTGLKLVKLKVDIYIYIYILPNFQPQPLSPQPVAPYSRFLDAIDVFFKNKNNVQ